MKYSLLGLILALFLSGFAQHASPIKSPDEKLACFLSVADSLRALANTPGVGIALVYDNKILFKGGIGLRDIENNLPVTENTLFAIGSCSKAFNK